MHALHFGPGLIPGTENLIFKSLFSKIDGIGEIAQKLRYLSYIRLTHVQS